MKLSAEEVVKIQETTQNTSQALITALVAAGKYNWQVSSLPFLGPGQAAFKEMCGCFMTATIAFAVVFRRSGRRTALDEARLHSRVQTPCALCATRRGRMSR